MAGCCFERRLIGEVLIDRGLVTREQLGRALEEQQRGPGGVFIGEILIRLGFLTEIDIVTALVLQCNLPYIAVSKHDIGRDVIGLIPADVARRDKLVPLDRIGNILSVVMLNPLNADARREVELVTGCKIATFISTRAEIETALERFYPAASSA